VLRRDARQRHGHLGGGTSRRVLKPCKRSQNNVLEEVFSETELPEVVILEIVLLVKEKEPQRWEHQKNPTLEFLGFAGSA
jgi:hypothetical protein